MDIVLYLDRSDTCAQMEHVLKQFGLPYVLRFKDVEADIQPWLGMPRSPVLVMEGRCTYFSPTITVDEFKLLVESCLIEREHKRRGEPCAE